MSAKITQPHTVKNAKPSVYSAQIAANAAAKLFILITQSLFQTLGYLLKVKVEPYI